MSGALTKVNENSLPFKGRVRVGMGSFSDEDEDREALKISGEKIAGLRAFITSLNADWGAIPEVSSW